MPKTTFPFVLPAMCLFQKRLALISEAPGAYFGSASCLFWKHKALIWEAHFEVQTIPCASMAFATFIKPAMFAPLT